MRWFFLVAVLALCSRVSAAPIQGPWQYVWEKGNAEEIIAGRVAFETTQRPSQIPGRHGDIVWLVHSFDSSAGKTIYAVNGAPPIGSNLLLFVQFFACFFRFDCRDSSVTAAINA
jgi:hypothetical protein